jgi:hypothetical protein
MSAEACPRCGYGLERSMWDCPRCKEAGREAWRYRPVMVDSIGAYGGDIPPEALLKDPRHVEVWETGELIPLEEFLRREREAGPPEAPRAEDPAEAPSGTDASSPARPPPGTEDPPPVELPDLVTLDQAAAAAKCSKRTLERYKTAGKLPAPVVEGGAGKANLYDWPTMREWIEAEFGIKKLPERYPANRRHG